VPFDVPGARVAAIADPAGAVVSLWQPRLRIGLLDHDVAFGAGALCHRPASKLSSSQLYGRSCPSGPGSAPSKMSLTNGRLCQPEMPFDAGSVHPRAGSAPQYGQILLPWRCHEDQEGLTASGDQASDLDFLVAGGT